MHINDLKAEWREAFERARVEYFRANDLIMAELNPNYQPPDAQLHEAYASFTGEVRPVSEGRVPAIIGLETAQGDYTLTWRFIARLRGDAFHCTVEISVWGRRNSSDEDGKVLLVMLERYAWPADANKPPKLLEHPFQLYVPESALPEAISPRNLVALLPEGEESIVDTAVRLLRKPNLNERWSVRQKVGELVLRALVRGFKQLPLRERDPLLHPGAIVLEDPDGRIDAVILVR